MPVLDAQAYVKEATKGELQIRPSRVGKSKRGEVALDWRELSYNLRVYAANKPLSYGSMDAVGKAGAQLHVQGLDEKKMSKMESASAATMHDQQNHLIQRRCARESLGKSPLALQWDEGSKRKKAWVCATLLGSREEVHGAAALTLTLTLTLPASRLCLPLTVPTCVSGGAGRRQPA